MGRAVASQHFTHVNDGGGKRRERTEEPHADHRPPVRPCHQERECAGQQASDHVDRRDST